MRRQSKQCRQEHARELRQILCQLDPSFIKFRQSLSVGPDIYPEEYIDDFSGLHDNAPSFPTSIASALRKEELGVSIIVMSRSAGTSLGQLWQWVCPCCHDEVFPVEFRRK